MEEVYRVVATLDGSTWVALICASEKEATSYAAALAARQPEGAYEAQGPMTRERSGKLP